MNVYRAKFGRYQHGGWVYYEDKNRLVMDLLEASLDIAREDAKNNWFQMMKHARWLDKLRRGKFQYNSYKSIQTVEKIENDQWVPVTWTFVSPAITFDGERL